MAQTILLSVPDDLLKEIKRTAKLTRLSVQEVFRQSVKIAQPTLRQTARAPRPKRLSLWDALASSRGVNLRIEPMKGRVKKTSL